MGIGAISAFQPYVYQTNTLNVNSLKPISAVRNDVTKSHIRPEKSSSESGQETINPLKRGETADFTGVLAMQMQMGMHNADLLMGGQSVFQG